MKNSTDEFRPETVVAIDAVKRALTIARRGVTRLTSQSNGPQGSRALAATLTAALDGSD